MELSGLKDKWTSKNINEDLLAVVMKECGLTEVQARLLQNRGIDGPESVSRYLKPSFDNLHDPFLFSEMEKAVSLINEAVREDRLILIHGDFDADGVTGTAVLYEFLKEIGADAHFFVPHRGKDGYGLSMRMMKRGVENGLGLVISVDCGGSDNKVVNFLAGKGVRTVITDHHMVTERVRADAVINPKMPGENYPFKELAGVGVAFKLVQALAGSYGMEDSMDKYLDLVALGTLGDYMELTGENRILVSLGLEVLVQWNRKGLDAIRSRSSLKRNDFSARQVCFTLVPRLNSPGRIGSARDVVKLLIGEEEEKIHIRAKQIEEMNIERKYLDSSVTREACYLADIYLKREEDAHALIFSSAAWHEGVVGIGAARLSERYGMPAALIAVQEDGVGKGSIRSSGGIHIRKALDACSELLIRYGGHRDAGGFSVKEELISDFAELFNRTIGVMSKGREEEISHADMEISLSDFNNDLIEFIARMEPFGPGNTEPVFIVRGVEVLNDCRIVGGNHLKFSGRQDDSQPFDFIGFSLCNRWKPYDIFGRTIDILGNCRVNKYRGKESKQLRVIDIRVNDAPAGDKEGLFPGGEQ
ncbi:MAG: single-stranded-DNA-specific exonuclease RecJ [Candidatus Krumholzibacteriales bacterium]